MNMERIESELAQAAAWLAVQAGENQDTVRTAILHDRGELIAVEVNGRVVGEVDKVRLLAEPPPKPGVN